MICDPSPDNTRPGPNSRHVTTPACSNAAIPSAKRTVCRTCDTQYSGSAIRSPARTPSRFEITGMRGVWKDSVSATARNSSNIGSINAEWNA
ncbi:hypothetical protein ACIBI7_42150, partial [Nonomuraea fuscirosea]|uniref:hypothetical protein n=1 Tax=Nonomuraea fuscirosea TaxID=1291556 RepID=UPI003793C84C